MPKVRGRTLRVLYDADAIAARNLALAAEIAATGYKNLLVVSVLKGSFVFAADLIRALHGAGLEPEV
jgi:hypoxanthine phosphoribosyltransferase